MWFSEDMGPSLRMLCTGMLIFAWTVWYSISSVYNTNITYTHIIIGRDSILEIVWHSVYYRYIYISIHYIV